MAFILSPNIRVLTKPKKKTQEKCRDSPRASTFARNVIVMSNVTLLFPIIHFLLFPFASNEPFFSKFERNTFDLDLRRGDKPSERVECKQNLWGNAESDVN